MFVAGHVGITLGAARVAAWGFDFARNRFDRSERSLGEEGKPARRSRLRDALDDRALAFGSLLPDILDKPIALVLAGDLVGNGTRNIGHTLIFALALVAAAIAATVALRRGWPMALALASAGHLALDGMWNHARTLFWPLTGWAFPLNERATVTEWTESTLSAIPDRLGDPLELAGLAVICWIAARVLWSRSVKSYLLTGRIGRECKGMDTIMVAVMGLFLTILSVAIVLATFAFNTIRADNARIEASIEASRADQKADVDRLEAGIEELRTERKADTATLRAERKADIAELRAEQKADADRLEAGIAELSAERRADINMLSDKIDALEDSIGVLEDGLDVRLDEIEREQSRLRGSVEALRGPQALSSPPGEDAASGGGFDVYADGDRLIYTKAVCDDEDTRGRFFLSVFPADPSDLPQTARDAGREHESLNFDFYRYGAILDGSCVITRYLPDYAIRNIETGQWIPGEGELWRAEIAVGG